MIVQFPFPEENRRSNKYDVNFYKDIVPITINGGLTNNNTWQNILYIEYGQLCIYSDIEHVSVSNCSFYISILTELQLHRVSNTNQKLCLRYAHAKETFRWTVH